MIFINNSRNHTRKRLTIRIIVVYFLICACFRGTLCTLAQDTDSAEYAGGTTVKANVSAEPADVPGEGMGKSDEVDENVETSDENIMILWIIMLVSSLTILICVIKARNTVDNGKTAGEQASTDWTLK